MSLKHPSLGLAILLLLLGVTIIAVRPVFAQVLYSMCVVELGVENSDGTITWVGYAGSPDTPISECQDNTGLLGQDVLGRTIIFHQFIRSEDVTGCVTGCQVDVGTTVTGTFTFTTALASTSTTALASTSTTLESTSTTALATSEAPQNSALAILIVAILAVVVLQKRAKPSSS